MKEENTQEQKRDEVVEEGKSQLDALKAELVELKDKVAHLSDEAKKEFDERSVELEELYHDALKGYEKLKLKTEEGWHETRDFVILTNKALRHSFKYFLSHYKRKEPAKKEEK